MKNLDTREWLLTNGLGSFASGTVCDAHTRTYHGWLMAALDPPAQRTLLLARIDASLIIAGQELELATNFWASGAVAPTGYQFLQSFEVEPVPTWMWDQAHWQLTRRLMLPYGLPLSTQTAPQNGQLQFCNRVLVHYRYEGNQSAILKLRVLVGDRNFHHQQHADSDLQFSQVVQPHCLLLQAIRPDWVGTPWQLRWTNGHYQPDGMWYWDYHYPEETRRGLHDREDLYNPGNVIVLLQPGETITLEASVRYPDTPLSRSPLNADTFDQAIQAEQQRLASEVVPLAIAPAAKETDRLWRRLLQAGDRFICYRASISGPTVIAGYPWFNDWGRDTLIALPGLALTTQRFELAKGLLKTFGHYCQHGLIPNAFPDAGAQPFYNSVDAALWWIETLGLYLEATQDWAFLQDQYAVVRSIYKGIMAGTLHGIRVDAFDGLVTWDSPGVALTWMDVVVDGEPITPRRGKPIEINALWYSGLCWAQQWAIQLQHMDGEGGGLEKQIHRYAMQAEQVKESLQKYWNPSLGYFYDTIAPDDYPDPKVRPNAVIALSLAHCGFSELHAQQVLQVARDRLLTPYGLRSLDPADPNYVGRYAGNLSHRDRAYHQGTVWSWLIGPFVRAWKRFYPLEPLPFNSALLINHFQHDACLGSISEIFDGDAPHSPQGAIAQAWSVAEVIRHWDDISLGNHHVNK
ncbi:glycogen debranching enzyme family protein [Oculatella sp. LEGE 06141]|uniref:amylo-alpha-1,6-glucosidase n=1 Tax=Oculatella sp. LEGE 06141 TaxID=1828648 RepID=UPI001880FADF|nr:amylo-alpha-1,6-glucosidase [Oculatella sp. LEGE 06141]MBE9179406.1 glycogen debranching enzyme family protein [Oculatella sp. LEGE 06141]